MRKLALLPGILLLATSLSAQFSATMSLTTSGETRDFKVFCDENRYRYEITERGQEVVVIVLNETNEFFLVMPQQQMAIKSSASGQMGVSMDPLQTYEHFIDEKTKEIIVGKETINGYECIKKELHSIQEDEYGSADQLLFTVWYSEKLQFPLKMVNYIDGTNTAGMEIKDIQAWTPNETSFQIPEGYNIMNQENMIPGQ